jgi:cytochrome P450
LSNDDSEATNVTITATKHMPAPPARGLGGHLRPLTDDPLAFFESCAREYGDFVPLRLVGRPAFFLNHPDYIEQVLVTDQRHFSKGRDYRRNFRFLGNGLLTSEGDFWLRQRRLIQPAFHRQRIGTYGTTMIARSQDLLERWPQGAMRDIHEDMMHVTIEIVAKTLFGIDAAAEAAIVGRALDAIIARYVETRGSVWHTLLPDRIPTRGNRRYNRAVAQLDAVTAKIIDRHRAGEGDRDDLLTMLLEARDEDGKGMSDRQLRDEVLTLLLAGHETTANTLSWAWHLLGTHPEVATRLRAELDAVLGGRPPETGDAARLPYTNNLIKEALRLYPPSYIITREAATDGTIGGYPVPAGALILFSQWVMHRDARYFPEPERCNPDRWADGLEQRLPRYAYFPFGGGPRMCIGNQFALMEAALVLTTLAQRACLDPAPGRSPTPLAAITLRPKDGVWMVVNRRQ